MFDDYRIKRNSTRISVEPEKLFEDWAFIIDKPQWGIFGVFYGSWLDDEKNKPLREVYAEQLIQNGCDPKDAKKQAAQEIRWKIYGWGVQKELDNYNAFDTGYCFYHKTKPLLLQIVDSNSDSIFVTEMDTTTKQYRSFYSTNAQDLVSVLRDGQINKMIQDSPLRMRECQLKYVINKDVMDERQTVITTAQQSLSL